MGSVVNSRHVGPQLSFRTCVSVRFLFTSFQLGEPVLRSTSVGPSPASLANKLSAVASSVRLDSSWSFTQAIGAGWRYRGISKSDIHRFSVDVVNYRTSYGAAVLLPSQPFADQLSEYYELG